MSSNSDEAPIGGRKLVGPKSVAVTYAASKYGGVARPAATPKPAVAAPAAAARNETLGPVLRRAAAAPALAKPAAAAPAKKAVRFADAAPAEGGVPALVVEEVGEAAAAVAAAEEAPPAAAGGEAAAAAEEAPPAAAEEAPAAVAAGGQETAGEAATAAAALEEFQRRLRGIGGSVSAIPPPADAPAFDEAAFKKDVPWKTALQATVKPESAPAGNEYIPIRSAEFQDFMVQVYGRYSPYRIMLEEAVKAGKAIGPGQLPEKELDKDACKRRDPNKVETFYYQKLVRDYMSRATPYRGTLVYHGLGTGKTCTSIAAAEALYWGNQKKIFVLTPATLSNNYRRELSKCGYFPLRRENEWTFYNIAGGAPSASMGFFLFNIMGLPEELVRKQGGAWIPNPLRPSNWKTLTPEAQASVDAQMSAHLNYRFKFIHYNGVSPPALAALAEAGYKAGESPFDNAVVIIDEVHNLVRTINGTQIGSVPLADFIEKIEPREPTWSLPLRQQREGYRYPRGYTLYRLLTNAVGCKIIALSATPMINYAQEFGILMNLVGGEQRVAEISLATAARDPATITKIEEWCLNRPDVDFWAIEEGPAPGGGRRTVLSISPVPYGYAKVIKAGAPKTTVRGFVRLPDARLPPVAACPERNMNGWAVSLIKDLEAQGILTAGAGAAAEADAMAAAPGAWGTPPKPLASTHFRVVVGPLLYDAGKRFVETFVDRNTLAIKHGNLLRARATGLISFYKGGSEELMPRTSRNEVVEVPMSDYMFQEYTRARMIELEMEDRSKPAAPKDGEEAGGGKAKRRGATRAEQDLYAQATKSTQTGFLALSRAACNWVFPEDVPRPQLSVKQQTQLLGMEQDKIIAADLAEDTDVDLDAAPAGGAAAAAAGPEDAEAAAAEAAAAVPDAPEAAAAPSALDATLAGILGTLMSGLEAKADDYLNKALAQFSPKYAEIIGRIRASPGPALVYSQFKTLEGLGIFAAALRASDEKYLPLDIQKGADGEWEIPAPLMDPARPRYILYTGDQDLEKRRLLLQLYNADVAGLPPKLSAQCAELLAGAPDNRDGRVCRVFMITQSGAEGISLFNTRQVHVMEPYWNNVRIQQVVGRAIRLCSHMNLPWDDRTVDVFTYISVFSVDQKATGAKTVMLADGGKTTDETIFELAKAKQKLADGLFEIAQDAAIDCEVHNFEHGAVAHCFRYPEGTRPMFLYHPDIERDVAAVGAAAAGGGAAGGRR